MLLLIWSKVRSFVFLPVFWLCPGLSSANKLEFIIELVSESEEVKIGHASMEDLRGNIFNPITKNVHERIPVVVIKSDFNLPILPGSLRLPDTVFSRTLIEDIFHRYNNGDQHRWADHSMVEEYFYQKRGEDGKTAVLGGAGQLIAREKTKFKYGFLNALIRFRGEWERSYKGENLAQEWIVNQINLNRQGVTDFIHWQSQFPLYTPVERREYKQIRSDNPLMVVNPALALSNYIPSTSNPLAVIKEHRHGVYPMDWVRGVKPANIVLLGGDCQPDEIFYYARIQGIPVKSDVPELVSKCVLSFMAMNMNINLTIWTPNKEKLRPCAWELREAKPPYRGIRYLQLRDGRGASERANYVGMIPLQRGLVNQFAGLSVGSRGDSRQGAAGLSQPIPEGYSHSRAGNVRAILSGQNFDAKMIRILPYVTPFTSY